MSGTAELVIATRNAGKRYEFERLTAGLGLRIRSLDEFSDAPDPEETGMTFRENALIKAKSAANATRRWSLGDDSGLCVEALDGRPGIYSARYADGTDETRWQKLLRELKDVPDDRRSATFICALALVSPSGESVVAEGRCPGSIGRAPKGDLGFGYDPVFLVGGDPDRRTMAELSDEEKSIVSHRGRAFDLLREQLQMIGGSRISSFERP